MKGNTAMPPGAERICMHNNSEIRARARAALGGNIFAETWLFGLLVCFIISMLISMATSFVIGILVVGPLTFSLSYMFMARARGKEKFDIMDITQGFMNGQFVHTTLLYLLRGVFIFLWSLLLIVPGVIKSYSYRLAFYVAADRPDLPVNECLAESARLMRGHKWRAFCMDLVMFLWSLLGSCVCGLGTLWVAPYREAAMVAFYEDLRS